MYQETQSTLYVCTGQYFIRWTSTYSVLRECFIYCLAALLQHFNDELVLFESSSMIFCSMRKTFIIFTLHHTPTQIPSWRLQLSLDWSLLQQSIDELPLHNDSAIGGLGVLMFCDLHLMHCIQMWKTTCQLSNYSATHPKKLLFVFACLLVKEYFTDATQIQPLNNRGCNNSLERVLLWRFRNYLHIYSYVPNLA